MLHIDCIISLQYCDCLCKPTRTLSMTISAHVKLDGQGIDAMSTSMTVIHLLV